MTINPRLPINVKIERYAYEPVAFYLHKNRNFLDKIRKAENEYKKSIEDDENLRNSINVAKQAAMKQSGI